MTGTTELHVLARHAVAHAYTFAHLHAGQEDEALGALASACRVLLVLQVGKTRADEIIRVMTEGDYAEGETGAAREDRAEDL